MKELYKLAGEQEFVAPTTTTTVPTFTNIGTTDEIESRLAAEQFKQMAAEKVM